MTCAEFKELVGLYALGTLDDSDRAECETHLRYDRHDGCVEALAEQSAAVAALGDDLPPVPPGPHVWKGIEQRIGLSVLPARRKSRAGPIGWALFAAAAAAAIFFFWDRRRAETELAELRAGQKELRDRIDNSQKSLAAVAQQKAECTQRLQAMEKDLELRDQAVALLELPGTELFPVAPTDKATPYLANAILHTGVKKAFIVATGLKPQPGKGYEAWVVKGKAAHPAGMFTVDAQGRGIVEVKYETMLAEGEKPDALAVTIEPEGGSKTPTPPIILAGSPRGG